jgi:hypothetical protein
LGGTRVTKEEQFKIIFEYIMEKEFLKYEQALALKELGFDEPSLGWYTSDGSLIKEYITNKVNKFTLAPTFSQAFRWFRDKYGLKHDIDDDNVGTKFYYKISSYTDKFDNYDDIIKPMREERDWSKIEFYSYEETELACLKKLIELVKEKII